MKVLIANRGEIACRIVHTLRELGVGSVAVCTEPDATAPHTWLADEVVHLGSDPRAYLSIEALLHAAKRTGATAIHPGYGFLSQSPDFARACKAHGLIFIGPSAEAMVKLGDKRGSRTLAAAAGVPVIPGAEHCETVEQAKVIAARVGYPVLLKAAGGGGGKGMRRVDAESELGEALSAAKREAAAAFNDERMLIEKYVVPARHVEVQVLGDGRRAVALGERECSLQRRYQKIIEEGPAPTISETTRRGLHESAVRVAEAAGYASAGTVEFLVGPGGEHYFLEVNTRLQVEHPVTELLTGIDIVAEQVKLAAGEPLRQPAAVRGHAIEARLNAEDPYKGFLPQTGELVVVDWPHVPGVRIDAGVTQGSVISPHYDSMIAKVIAWGENRELARRRLVEALRSTIILGVHTNQAFLLDVLERDFFKASATYTNTIEAQAWPAPSVPAFVDTAATMARRLGPAGGSASGGHGARPSSGEVYTPWTSLTGFRMGA